jgi:hypothetical protein
VIVVLKQQEASIKAAIFAASMKFLRDTFATGLPTGKAGMDVV